MEKSATTPRKIAPSRRGGALGVKRRDSGLFEVFEQVAVATLSRRGYHYRRRAHIGYRPGGMGHVIDLLAWNEAHRTFFISLKCRQVSAGVEQKLPFEVICLAEAVRRGDARYANTVCEHCERAHYRSASEPAPGSTSQTPMAYVVLGGTGWSLRRFFTVGDLQRHLTFGHLVTIVPFEDFIALADAGEL